MRPIIRSFLALWLVLFSLAGWAQQAPWWVEFKLNPAKSAPGKTEWIGSYLEDGKEARFVISIPSNLSPPNNSGGMLVGSVQRVPGSQSERFLLRLSHALGGRGKVPSSSRLDSVPIIWAPSAHQSRSSRSSGFSSVPAGDWIAGKLYFDDGAAEVYMNLNPKEGIGEFSVKDAVYAEKVLRALASVL